MTTTIGLTPEQLHAYRGVLTNLDRQQVQTIGGCAGSGKTHLLTRLAAALPTFVVVAYTAKAAAVLRSRGVKATTIHQIIYRHVGDDEEEDGGQRPLFELRDRPRGNPDGFLVDESSMIGRELYADLIGFGLPVIFTGDHFQLPPISDIDAGLMKCPDFVLEDIHRSASPICFFGDHLRKGGFPDTFDGLGGAVRLVGERDRHPEVSQAICGFNSTRVAYNRNTRRLLGREDDFPEPDDRVICLRNDHARGIFNGSQGTVLGVDSELFTLDLLLDDNQRVRRKVPFDPTVFNQTRPRINFQSGFLAFDYSWCITVHKSQGDEWPSVFVCEEHCDYWLPSRWNYTAATRARERVYWLPCRRPTRVAVAPATPTRR
jgi:exodeoxyribonuclease-5